MSIRKIHITIQNDQFTIDEKDHKPLKKGSALNTLNQIEEIMLKKLKCSQSELSQLSQDGLWRQLEQKAAGIQEGYLGKTSQLSFLSRFFGRVAQKEKKIKALYSRIRNLAARPTIELPNDMLNEICSFLPVKDLLRFSQANCQLKRQAEQELLKRAQEYGYKGFNLNEAAVFLQELFRMINASKKSIAKEHIAYQNSHIDSETTFKNIRHNFKTVSINFLKEDLSPRLHLAVERGLYEVTKLLLILGADPNVGTRHGGVTPLHIACKKGNKDIVELLIKNGADVNAKSWVGVTPLQHIIFHHSKKCLVISQLLLKNGANATINQLNISGKTALHLAIERNCCAQLIKLLLDNGADKNLRTGQGLLSIELIPVVGVGIPTINNIRVFDLLK